MVRSVCEAGQPPFDSIFLKRENYKSVSPSRLAKNRPADQRQDKKEDLGEGSSAQERKPVAARTATGLTSTSRIASLLLHVLTRTLSFLRSLAAWFPINRNVRHRLRIP